MVYNSKFTVCLQYMQLVVRLYGDVEMAFFFFFLPLCGQANFFFHDYL